MLQVIVYLTLSLTLFILCFSSNSKLMSSFGTFYSDSPNNYGIAMLTLGLIIENSLILVFTSTLLLLHYKLYRLDLTAYEYLLYCRDRKERVELLKAGVITKDEFEEEDRVAIEDIRKIKRSKIIREVRKKRVNGDLEKDLGIFEGLFW